MKLDAGTTIVVTGAGGFIGTCLVRRFRERGAKVRGLDVSSAAAARIGAAGGEPIVGDVTNARDAARACEGADVVVHTAAVVGEGGDWTLYRRVNVEGTRTMAEATRGVFVQLSSVMVYGFDFPDGVTEEGPFRGENNPYCQTKIESEAVVMDLHRRGALRAIVVRPGDVYGPGSLPWVVRPLEMMKKRLFAIPRGGVINPIWVEDLADGIVAAIERDAHGEAFNLSGGVAVPCREYFARLAAIIGRGPPLEVSPRVLRPAFRAIERACDALHLEPPARADAVSFLMRPHAYSIEKARRVLGWSPRVDVEEGMRRIAAQYRA